MIGLNDDDRDKVPGEGEWPVRRVIEHILEVEEPYDNRIEETVADTSD